MAFIRRRFSTHTIGGSVETPSIHFYTTLKSGGDGDDYVEDFFGDLKLNSKTGTTLSTVANGDVGGANDGVTTNTDAVKDVTDSAGGAVGDNVLSQDYFRSGPGDELKTRVNMNTGDIIFITASVKYLTGAKKYAQPDNTVNQTRMFSVKRTAQGNIQLIGQTGHLEVTADGAAGSA